jgi:hypothetical protein
MKFPRLGYLSETIKGKQNQKDKNKFHQGQSQL